MARAPLIAEVKSGALDDGPGMRTVVFFKGCPLSCVWCHNPECIRPEAELAFAPESCVACDTCLGACTEDALLPAASRAEPREVVDRSRCTLCFDCVEACPSGALSRVGRSLSVDALLELVRRDIPFFEGSGGGLTLSGGEPALYPEYAGELARRARELGVHVLLETCGDFPRDRFERELLPHLDEVYFDLKLADPAEHLALCGRDNRRILDNLDALLRSGVPLTPRIPLVPGLTATRENLRALARLLRERGLGRVALLPYNPLWPSKLAQLGRGPDARTPRTSRFMGAEEIEACREALAGLEIVR